MAGLSAGTVEVMDGSVVGRKTGEGNGWQGLTAPEEDHEGVDDDQSKGR